MCSRAADRLLAQVAADPWGQVSTSPYETGRLVALAPWLDGQEARLAYLCRAQHPDGSWGGPGGYALAPTLSATAALLAQLRRPVGRDRWEMAATTGLRALHRWLAPGSGLMVPDTIASELVIPSLVAEVNQLNDPALPPLPLPEGFSPEPLVRVRDGLAAGRLAPGLAYSLEVLGPDAVACPLVSPAAGAVGLSPAATAAWLGGPSGHQPAYEFLDRLQDRGGGPVPVVTPITYFEGAWVLNNLAAGGWTTAPTAILDRLEAGLGEAGAPVAPGLPPDADDTGAVLSALLRYGRVRSPESLLGFFADGYFRCYYGERDPSVSANAHALEALARYQQREPDHAARFRSAARAAAGWLRECQHPDGSWWDKWHASPYYATAACVTALATHGGEGAATAVARAVAWVRDTEHPNGGWGRWQATAEETAYAVQILSHAPPEGATLAALSRAAAFLARPDHPEYPLWHGKDLYAPRVVVQAAQVGARMLTDRVRAGDQRVPRPRPSQRPGSPPAGSPQIGAPVEVDRQL